MSTTQTSTSKANMPVEVVARTMAEIPKDLTRYPTDVLLSHLQETLTEARVA